MIREQTRVHIRWCIRRDLPEVIDIEFSSYEEAWSEEDFLKHLRERNCIAMVAETEFHGDEGKIVGFMLYLLEKDKLPILRFAVLPRYRRKGIGTQMLDKLKNKLSSHRRTRITIDVPDNELRAHLFLKNNEFQGSILSDEEYHFVYRHKGD